MSLDQEEDFVDLSGDLESLQGGHERKDPQLTRPGEQPPNNLESDLDEQLREEVSSMVIENSGEHDPILPSIEPSELLPVVPSVAISTALALHPEEGILMASTAPIGSDLPGLSVSGPDFGSSFLSSVSPSALDSTTLNVSEEPISNPPIAGPFVSGLPYSDPSKAKKPKGKKRKKKWIRMEDDWYSKAEKVDESQRVEEVNEVVESKKVEGGNKTEDSEQVKEEKADGEKVERDKVDEEKAEEEKIEEQTVADEKSEDGQDIGGSVEAGNEDGNTPKYGKKRKGRNKRKGSNKPKDDNKPEDGNEPENGNKPENDNEPEADNNEVNWPDPDCFVYSCLSDEDSKETTGDSPSRSEWLRQKREESQKNKYLDLLMSMVGLEEVKSHFLTVKAGIEAARKRGEDLQTLNLNLVLVGKLGTGKKTIAELYAKFLISLKVILAPTNSCKTTGCTAPTINSEGGAIIFEKADGHINCFIPKTKSLKGKVVLICLGRLEKTIDDLAANADSRWKLPQVIKLHDYSDDELLQILIAMIKHRKMEVEGDSDNFYLRVLVRRVARSRGSSVFGNVRSLENALDKVCERQALRLRGEWSQWSKKNGSKEGDESDKGKGGDKGEEKGSPEGGETPEEKGSTREDESDKGNQSVEKAGVQTGEKTEEKVKEVEEEVGLEQSSTTEEKISPEDDKPKNNILMKEDIFGPEPSDIRDRSTAWKELQSMIGLESVKSAVEELLTRAKANYDREIEGKEPIQTNLNRVFLGPPGSGKTTVARLYGRVLADLGLLSSGDMVLKTPADLLSNFIGESELNTTKTLDAAEGKVLILDDAHMLYKTSGHGTDDTDKFRVGIIDTLVAKIPSTPGDDRCVILVGYEDRMKEMFQNCNPGLQRRFPLEDSFIFENYNEIELGKILELKLDKEEIIVNDKARQVAQEVLNRMRIRPNFGNGGDVENLLGRAKIGYRKRISASTSKTSGSTQITLEPEDFDPDYDRASRATKNCKALFDNFVGFDKIIKQFQAYQRTVANMRRHDIDPRPHIPWAFVFKGPPGTGKTTTAKKVGQIFYDMGFLSSDEVITCSVTDIIGEYTGHTGPKVISQFERGLGKVLFIDEAYRLAPAASGGGGSFAAEAIGELVDAMTKPRYAQNMIVILAGYTEEMEFLMRSNQGLRGRFPTEVIFHHMQPEQCLKHLKEEILKVKVEIWDKSDPGEEKRKKVLRLFYKLSTTKSWSNGRDVETLARTIIRHVFDNEATEETTTQPLTISTDRLIKFLQDLLRERKRAEIERETED